MLRPEDWDLCSSLSSLQLCSGGFEPCAKNSQVMSAGCCLLAVRTTALLVILLLCSVGAPAYSVLTHEEIVDLLWTNEIRPLLLERYPGLSEDQIRRLMRLRMEGGHSGSGLLSVW